MKRRLHETGPAGALVLALFLLLPFRPAVADCGKTPGQLASSLKFTPDPIEKMRRLMAAMDKCGTGKDFDLLIDRKALALDHDLAEVKALEGTWVADMWLPVAKGLASAMVEVLTVRDGNVEQTLWRWYDAEAADDPALAPKYVLDLASALAGKPAGAPVVIEIDHLGSFGGAANRYATSDWRGAKLFLHQFATFMTIDLRAIKTIRAGDDRLLLVDRTGNVRSYTRTDPRDMRVSHTFMLVTEISASRYWRCFLGLLRNPDQGGLTGEQVRSAADDTEKAAELMVTILAKRRDLTAAQAKGEDAKPIGEELKALTLKRVALAQSQPVRDVAEALTGGKVPGCLEM